MGRLQWNVSQCVQIWIFKIHLHKQYIFDTNDIQSEYEFLFPFSICICTALYILSIILRILFYSCKSEYNKFILSFILFYLYPVISCSFPSKILLHFYYFWLGFFCVQIFKRVPKWRWSKHYAWMSCRWKSKTLAESEKLQKYPCNKNLHIVTKLNKVW